MPICLEGGEKMEKEEMRNLGADLNGALTGIVGYADLARDAIESGNVDLAKKYLEQSLISSGVMKKMISERLLLIPTPVPTPAAKSGIRGLDI